MSGHGKRPWLFRPVVPDVGIARYPIYWVVVAILLVWVIMSFIGTFSQ